MPLIGANKLVATIRSRLTKITASSIATAHVHADQRTTMMSPVRGVLRHPGRLKLLVMLSLALASGCYDVQTEDCGDGLVCSVGQHCTKNRDGCTDNLCGNGVVDPGEICDDGNVKDNDTCRSDCMAYGGCGNGNQKGDCGSAPRPDATALMLDRRGSAIALLILIMRTSSSTRSAVP